MPLTIFNNLTSVHLEAEVATRRVPTFVTEYQTATGITLTPDNEFQVQQDKYGLEGRVYFDATTAEASALKAMGLNVEGPHRTGYKGDEYAYRISNNELFWELVNAGYRI